MSPEQASGEVLDARSDLFSLGVVLYECLTGRPPFAAESLPAVLARVLTWQPPQPSRLNPQSPAQLDRIILKLLEKDRKKRYASADELLGRHAGSRTRPFPPPRRGRAGRRHGLRWRRRSSVAVECEAPSRPGAGRGWVVSRRPRCAAQRQLSPGEQAPGPCGGDRPSYAMAHAYLAEAWYELDYLERAKDELLKAMASLSSLPTVEKLHLDAIHQTVIGEFKAAVGEVPGDFRDGGAGRARRRAARTGPFAGTQPGYEEGHGDVFRSDSPKRAELRQNAAVWLRLGTLQARTGAREDSGRSLDRAESLFQAASNLEGVTECLYIRARYAGTPAQARDLIGKALSAARVTGNDQQQIKLLLLSSNAISRPARTRKRLTTPTAPSPSHEPTESRTWSRGD